MKRIERITAGMALALSLTACGLLGSKNEDAAATSIPPEAERPGPPALIVGTTIEAASQKPLAGVQITGPDGTAAESDRDGRFELRGLTVGTGGELLATTAEGLTGRVVFRPLKHGALEVVLLLR